MPFFDEISGTLTFQNGLRLSPFAQREALLELLQKAGGTAPDLGTEGVLVFPAGPVKGGSVAPVCLLRDDALWQISLSVGSVGPKPTPTAEQQRAFLFGLFRLKDPCPDTQRNCLFRGDGWTLTLSTDPRLGHAIASLSYR